MKNFLDNWLIPIALLVIYVGGFALILWMCWIYLNGGF